MRAVIRITRLTMYYNDDVIKKIKVQKSKMKIFVLFQSEQQQQQQQMIWFGERERIILPTPSGRT